MADHEQGIQNNVRNFYDQVGWKLESDGFYQNAMYEDLRPVSWEYIHRCHMRVKRHLANGGRFFLDAGSGPIQWPEYLTYSAGYDFRVCADLSIEGLKEARKRIGEHGLFVVADISHLPFADESFDGVVSLHTIHHVPADDKKNAYLELHRTLKSGRRAVVVNGWGRSPMMIRWSRFVGIMEKVFGLNQKPKAIITDSGQGTIVVQSTENASGESTGTYIEKDTPQKLLQELAKQITLEILVWRSVSVRFLRAMIHPWLLGRLWLKLLYRLEERNPQKYGNEGQYPLIILYK